MKAQAAKDMDGYWRGEDPYSQKHAFKRPLSPTESESSTHEDAAPALKKLRGEYLLGLASVSVKHNVDLPLELAKAALSLT